MTFDKRKTWSATAGLALGGLVVLSAHAAAAAPQASAAYYPARAPDTVSHITAKISDSDLVSLESTPLPTSLAKYDAGALPSDTNLGAMHLLLQRSDRNQSAFEQYSKLLTQPGSAYFHHWLTQAQVGDMFGPSKVDITKVQQWLASKGLRVTSVSPDGLVMNFSGTAAAINSAFHVPLHRFLVNGEQHTGSLSKQQIPAALAPVVLGVASLNDFAPKPLHIDVGTARQSKKTGAWETVAKAKPAVNGKPIAQFTTGTTPGYDVVPADLRKIYNVHPLWATGTRGAGQTVVVLERTDINLSDVAAFRKAFLPADAAGTVTIVHPTGAGVEPCKDPGINADESEAALDAEWAGAAAPDANIVVASCKDAGDYDFGPLQAAANYSQLTMSGPPPIYSLSYGGCEAFIGYSAIQADYLWADLAAAGSTVFVSTGDSGSAGCDSGSTADNGPTINGLASSRFDTAVGGTDFLDYKNYAPYWAATNKPLYQSALSYIPETTWNDSCASSLVVSLQGAPSRLAECRTYNFLDVVGGSGGQSIDFYQEEWQQGVFGMVNHTTRTIPDVSLFASNGFYGHALVYCMSNANQGGAPCDYSNAADITANIAGGTSFTAPIMAGVEALINQTTGGGNGNINPALYNLATVEYGTVGAPNSSMLASCNSSNGANIDSSCVFNDITNGDIVEPCDYGSVGCYTGKNGNDVVNALGYTVGAISNSLKLQPAWESNAGYDMATGLGSVNVTNLVRAMFTYSQNPPRSNYNAPGDFLGYQSIFTGDGNSDIAVMDPDKGIITGYAMKGNLSLDRYRENQFIYSYNLNRSSPIPTGLTLVDVGNYFASLDSLGPKSDELALVNPSDNTLYLWISYEQGVFAQAYQGKPYPMGWKLLGSAVYDDTNTQALFWFNSKLAEFSWLKTDVDTTTTKGAVTSSDPFSGMPGFNPALADVNGDGFADIVWTSALPADDRVFVWINDKSGGFIKYPIGHSNGFALFGAGDVDGDGKTDLIWTNPKTHQMMWWIMNGATVQSTQVVSVPQDLTMVSIADYNNDALVDILWQGAEGNLVQWLGNGKNFRSADVSDMSGNLIKVPAGSKVQVNRLQGSAIRLQTGTGYPPEGTGILQ